MEAKKIIGLIKDDIAHLEEITHEFSIEILPPSDDVDLAIVRAKALVTELELLKKLTSPKIQEPIPVQHTVIQDPEPNNTIEFSKKNLEISEKVATQDIIQIPMPEVESILRKDIEPKVEKGNDEHKPVSEPEKQKIEIPVVTEKIVQDETPVEKKSQKDIPTKIKIEEHKSINETLRESNQVENDLLQGEKINLGYPITPIKRIWDAIGINDRFLFVRELFDNDSNKLESTVKTIDEFASIQEAVNYLKTNFKWNNSEASQRFLILVKQRFTK